MDSTDQIDIKFGQYRTSFLCFGESTAQTDSAESNRNS